MFRFSCNKITQKIKFLASSHAKDTNYPGQGQASTISSGSIQGKAFSGASCTSVLWSGVMLPSSVLRLRDLCRKVKLAVLAHIAGDWCWATSWARARRCAGRKCDFPVSAGGTGNWDSCLLLLAVPQHFCVALRKALSCPKDFRQPENRRFCLGYSRKQILWPKMWTAFFIIIIYSLLWLVSFKIAFPLLCFYRLCRTSTKAVMFGWRRLHLATSGQSLPAVIQEHWPWTREQRRERLPGPAFTNSWHIFQAEESHLLLPTEAARVGHSQSPAQPGTEMHT